MFSFFTSNTPVTVLLVDISSASVAGAYARIGGKKPPTLYHTVRIPLEAARQAPREEVLIASLKVLGKTLTTEGTSVLMQETGQASVEKIIVSVSAPWQEACIRVARIEKDKPVLVTKALFESAIEKEAPEKEDRIQTEKQIVASILNGYEVERPYGKRAQRVELVVFSTSMSHTLHAKIQDELRPWHHSHAITFTSLAPLAFSAFRRLYPHEHDFLVLDVSGEATDIALVKRGALADVAYVPQGVHVLTRAAHGARRGTHTTGVIDEARSEDLGKIVSAAEKKWLEALTATLRDLSSHHPLPRTLFLLADSSVRDFLKRVLDDQMLRLLWLSDEPLNIIPTLPKHVEEHVSVRGTAEPDVYLALLALYVAENHV